MGDIYEIVVKGNAENEHTMIGYYRTNNQKFYETKYVNGKRNGKSVHWHDNGQIASEATFCDDKYDGKFTSYYRGGSPMFEIEYKNGTITKPVVAHREILYGYVELPAGGYSFSVLDPTKITNIRKTGEARYHSFKNEYEYEYDYIYPLETITTKRFLFDDLNDLTVKAIDERKSPNWKDTFK